MLEIPFRGTTLRVVHLGSAKFVVATDLGRLIFGRSNISNLIRILPGGTWASVPATDLGIVQRAMTTLIVTKEGVANLIRNLNWKHEAELLVWGDQNLG